MVPENTKLIKVGLILKPHGIRGELKIAPLTDDPKRFEKLPKVLAGAEENPFEYDISSVRYVGKSVIIKLSSVDTVEAAMKMNGQYLFITRSDLMRLPENTFYIFDLIGCKVYDEKNDLLGDVTDVISTGSNDVYVVKSADGSELLIPALKDVVRSVSISEKRISVILPEGLVE